MTSRGCTQLIDVIVPLPIYSCLTYALPADMPMPEKGSRVLVPVGKRKMAGIVWGECQNSPPESITIKPILKQLDAVPLINECLFQFLEWVANYYFHPIGMVVAEAMPPGIISAYKGRQNAVSRPFKPGAKAPELAAWSEKNTPYALTEHQEKALVLIKKAIQQNQYKTFLLHGVTGCGKTEVYIHAARNVLAEGKQALIMVPEIAMTAQIVGRFLKRFGSSVSVLHSGLTPSERRNQWSKIRNGESNIIIGTRSAVFAPLERIGLIVVDEEHDPSYKQDEHLRYHGRDLAVVRGRLSNAAVVLGSATPSLSSMHNAMQGKYQLISMPERIAGRPMPEIVIVDRSQKGAKVNSQEVKRPSWLSKQLYQEIKATFEKGEQVLLFLNRRGFAPYVFCPDCGHVFRCEECDVTMTFHRSLKKKGEGDLHDGLLRCHYCGSEHQAMPVCPKCRGLSAIATGYGTQKVASELKKLFPEKEICRLDRDTASSRKKMETLLQNFYNRAVDCLVGTQMVTKGHDFPYLTLVGVVAADQSLNFPEYHASERTFQILLQVSGRPGRNTLPGKVVIQTHNPHHYVFKYLMGHDFNGFAQEEMSRRKALSYPPFGRLINLRLSGKTKSKVEAGANNVASVLKKGARSHLFKDVEILGPAPAPLSRIKGRYRYQVLIKGTSISDVRKACSYVLQNKAVLCPSSVRMDLDVDPQRLL